MTSFDAGSFDDEVRPVDDFFYYVNHKWIVANPIPADESRWGSFDILRVEVEEQLKKILNDIAGQGDVGTPAGSDVQNWPGFL